MAIGCLLIVWMTISPGWTGPLAAWRSPFHANLIIVFGTLTILAAGLVLGRARVEARLVPGSPKV